MEGSSTEDRVGVHFEEPAIAHTSPTQRAVAPASRSSVVRAVWAALIGASSSRRAAEAAGEDMLSPSLPRAPVEPAKIDVDSVELASLRRREQEWLEAKKQIEAALMAKGEFLATMSHEIRTPLNGILPLLELVLATPLSDEQKQHLATIFQSSRELLRIVDNVLDYSKIESGGLQFETSGINLRELAESVVKLMERAATKKGLSLRLNIDPNVRLAVRGDPLRLRQILTNLVGNAIKFTERGLVQIDITREGESHTHHRLVFSVTDSGIGLDPQAAQRLFAPFSQADSSTTRIFGGTGLGLAICRRLTEGMGGQIGVRSELGRGSTFWFAIPLLKAIGDTDRAVARDRTALSLCRDPELQRRLGDPLREANVRSFDCDSVSDAMRRLQGRAQSGGLRNDDLVILDFKGFRRTAVSLARALAKEESQAHIPLLLLSDGSELPQELVQRANTRVLSRDADSAAVRDTLEKLLDADPNANPERSVDGPVIDIATPRAPGAFTGRRVLLVDDIPINRVVGEKVLSKLGLAVDLARNGREALQMLESGVQDIVLMDCQMPDVDGYTATRALRERELAQRLPRLPVVAMTANAMAGDREKCLAAGMDDYIKKPLNQDELARKLQHWFGIERTVVPVAAATIQSVPQGTASPLREVLDCLGVDMAAASESWYRACRHNVATLETALNHDDLRVAKSAHALLQRAGSALWAADARQALLDIGACLGGADTRAALALVQTVRSGCERVRQELTAS